MRIVFELSVALPNLTAVFVCGVPDLMPKESAAVLTDQLCGKHALSAVRLAESLTARQFQLYEIPNIRVNDRRVAVFHIILWHFALVDFLRFLQKICGEGFLQQSVTFMSGVVVHYYVWDTEIWQNLREDERGWHAADGSTRRKSQRTGGSTIGGNLDTIAIECIGDRKLSEDTTAKLVAWLCKKHGLDPVTDVYTHKYFYARKQCPQYILPHWGTFISTVQKYYNALTAKPAASKAETVGRTHTVKHGDTLWKIAEQYLGKGSRYTEIVKLNGLKSNVLMSGQVLQIPEK